MLKAAVNYLTESPQKRPLHRVFQRGRKIVAQPGISLHAGLA